MELLTPEIEAGAILPLCIFHTNERCWDPRTSQATVSCSDECDCIRKGKGFSVVYTTNSTYGLRRLDVRGICDKKLKRKADSLLVVGYIEYVGPQ
eukprot:scaffold117845_cov30-Attheya_sp.AAC.1